jgi:N-ethylmaleimide reductase
MNLMTGNTKHLLGEFELRTLLLPNRIVMAPMTRSRAIGAVPNALMRDYYAQRAGAGLIVTEGIAPSPNGLGYARIPGLFSHEQIAGWRTVTEGVHARGGRIFAQLMHVGRIAHPLNMPSGARIVAPSALAAAGKMYTDARGPQDHPQPAEMSAADIRATREEFVSAARNAIAAGFDGVELHGANGYLLEQFMHPHSNRRTDEYGGSDENRNRFVVEVAQATAAAIGGAQVGIRLSPYNTFNDLAPRDDAARAYAQLARELRGLAYVHLVRNAHPRYAATQANIRAAFGGPIMLNGGFDADAAERALAAGDADLISFGRPFIANPDFVRRVETHAALAEADAGTFYTPGAEGYLDYPALAS